MKYSTILFLLFSFFASAQTDEDLLENLKYVADMPYVCRVADLSELEQGPVMLSGCGDIMFWRIVQHKENMIEALIQKLSDTTTTSANVPNFGGYYTVGDIAFTAMQEIIKDIPTFKLLGVKFDEKGCGYCAYWMHLRKDIKNRQRFQTAVSKWYQQNSINLVWVTSDEVLTCDCALKHPNGGHFEVKDPVKK